MKKVFYAALALVLVAASLYAAGLIPPQLIADFNAVVAPAPVAKPVDVPTAPLITVARVEPADFVETVLVTGTFVPREEILVAPEVDGLRVLELRADEGDRVKAGQVLAVMVQETLDAQIAQNDAGLAKASAAIAQSRSQIVEAEARVKEAKAAFERAEPLLKAGHISQSLYDQRESAARTSEALLVAARDGLKVAEAEKAQVEAQRRETAFRLGKTEVTSPADGLVSRRTARIGAMASSTGDALFRIIENGEVELDAEVPEVDLAKIKPGQPARVSATGAGEVTGSVRLKSPEVDRATRLGRVRVFLGDNDALHIGAFGRGLVETSTSRGLAVPSSAVMHGAGGAYVQVVRDSTVVRRPVTLGLRMGDRTEITAGLTDEDMVVAKAGTFLRDGDKVRSVAPNPKVSEAGK